MIDSVKQMVESEDIILESKEIHYMEPARDDKLCGGFVGVIVRYDPNERRFLVHGTPFPGIDKMYFNSSVFQNCNVGDFWCIKVAK